MSKDKLEQLFKSSETEKNIPLSAGAWNRLNDLLDEKPQKSVFAKSWILGIAASFLVLFVYYLFSTAQQILII